MMEYYSTMRGMKFWYILQYEVGHYAYWNKLDTEILQDSIYSRYLEFIDS